MASLFDKHVIWRRGTDCQTVRVAAIDGGFDEPLSEGLVATERRVQTIVFSTRTPGSWLRTDTPMIGDEIEIDGAPYVVSQVKGFGSREYVLTVRSK